MILDLANIGIAAKKIDRVFDAVEIDLAGEPVTLNGTVCLDGETQKIHGKATVRGTIGADVLIDCTRCLEPIAKHFDIAFRAIFVDSSEENTDSEAEIGDEQLDESLVEDGKVDMAEVVREQILLALPEQIFCREDCKGLCAKCGASLNLIDCKCADDEIDPRWAALKNLK